MATGARGIKAPVQPAALIYAREKSGRDIGEIKARFPDFDKWENNDGKPTLAKARELAKFYDRPLTFLYLPKIPEGLEDPAPKDFRREQKGEPSRHLRRLLRQAHRRQKWAREYLLESPECRRFEMPDGFGKRPQNPEILGAQIREWLGIDGVKLKRLGKNKDALEYWRSRAEARGVIILQSHRHAQRQVSPEEFSGCAMADDVAPVVVLNSGDGETKRIFTLAHEIAHLWIDKPGMSRVSFRADFSVDGGDEAYCNAAAAAALMPPGKFKELWKNKTPDDENIKNIAGILKVSLSAVAVRAAKAGFIARKRCDELLEDYKNLAKEAAERKKANGGGGRSLPDKQAVQRSGEYFARLTLDAFEQGAISPMDVRYLFDVKLDYLGKIAERVRFPLHRWGRW